MKGVITKVDDKFCATVETLDSRDVLKLDQDDLETVIPKEGRRVKIVNGIGRGSIAILLSISVDDYCASVRIDNGSRRYIFLFFFFCLIRKALVSHLFF
jgi:DNA/RNA-binding protein KIN17